MFIYANKREVFLIESTLGTRSFLINIFGCPHYMNYLLCCFVFLVKTRLKFLPFVLHDVVNADNIVDMSTN